MRETLQLLLIVASACGQASTVVRETKLGKVRGNLVEAFDTMVEEYKSIPFAEPPIGHLRFKEPVPKAPWRGTWNGTVRGSICHQISHPSNLGSSEEFTEDCLHLNIWAPSKATRSPVLAWIHGGGFALGSASAEDTDARMLAAMTGFVVVSINYRLGMLGFLNANSPDAPGNQGLLDQHLALKWVQDNIDVFGGDPGRVTLMGHSAGSMSTHAHLLSPMSRGLFRRAIMLSGSATSVDFLDTVHESVIKGNGVATLLGCSRKNRDLVSHPEEVLECLRSKTAEELALATSEVVAPKEFTFFPTFHDQFLPKVPTVAMNHGFFQKVDVLVGLTSDEGAFMLLMPEFRALGASVPDIDYEAMEMKLRDVIASWEKSDVPNTLQEYLVNVPDGDKKELRKAYIDYMSDRVFNCPVQLFAEKYAARGNAVYSLVFTHRSERDGFPAWMGAPHPSMIQYVFALPFGDTEDYTEEDRIVSENVIKMLASFARDGYAILLFIDSFR
ncbi:unnamed protein product [Ixodes hexagonus]